MNKKVLFSIISLTVGISIAPTFINAVETAKSEDKSVSASDQGASGETVKEEEAAATYKPLNTRLKLAALVATREKPARETREDQHIFDNFSKCLVQ